MFVSYPVVGSSCLSFGLLFWGFHVIRQFGIKFVFHRGMNIIRWEKKNRTQPRSIVSRPNYIEVGVGLNQQRRRGEMTFI